MSRTLALLAALLLLASPAAAQTVRGQLVEDPGGRPVVGVLVVLLGADGAPAAAALTDAQGRFTLAAPSAGRWTVRAERVGYRTVAETIDLGAGETVERVLRTAPQVFVLPTVEAVAERRCVVRPGAGLQAYELWQEAAKALRATAVAQDRELVEYTVRTYRAELQPGGRHRRQRDEPRRVTGQPFETLSPAELARGGYLREEGDTIVLHGPDAAALLSDEFLDTHCLYVQTEGGRPGELGIAFEPVGTRGSVDIRGTIWLDGRTGELRLVRYEYTGLAASSRRSPSGGEIEFERLESGAWIVRRWRIRTARILQGPGWNENTRANEIIADLREAGGEVTDVQLRPATP